MKSHQHRSRVANTAKQRHQHRSRVANTAKQHHRKSEGCRFCFIIDVLATSTYLEGGGNTMTTWKFAWARLESFEDSKLKLFLVLGSCFSSVRSSVCSTHQDQFRTRCSARHSQFSLSAVRPLSHPVLGTFQDPSTCKVCMPNF